MTDTLRERSLADRVLIDGVTQAEHKSLLRIAAQQHGLTAAQEVIIVEAAPWQSRTRRKPQNTS